MQIRKRVVRFQVVNKSGRPLSKANISVKQLRQEFPFGNAISNLILTNQPYRDWFFPRFKYTVFENEMKWYETEHFPAQLNYSVPDAMLDLVSHHGVKVRGHNVFWEESERQPWWVKRLPLTDLPIAADRRLRSVMRHYKGRVIHWDVLNENLHHSFFERRLGKDTPAVFYKTAQEIDPETPLFLNEFNTLEQPEDASSTPAMYLEKIKQIRREGYHGPLSIGLESHFSTPSLAYVRTSIDVLAASKLPVWITELDVSKRPNQMMQPFNYSPGIVSKATFKGAKITSRSPWDYNVGIMEAKRDMLPNVSHRRQFQELENRGRSRRGDPGMEARGLGWIHRFRRLLQCFALSWRLRGECRTQENAGEYQ